MKKIISLCISALLFIITPCTCFAEEETKNYVQCTLLMEASTGTVISEENGYKRVPQGTLKLNAERCRLILSLQPALMQINSRER